MLRDEDGGYYISKLSKLNYHKVINIGVIDQDQARNSYFFGVTYSDERCVLFKRFVYDEIYQINHDHIVFTGNVLAKRFDSPQCIEVHVSKHRCDMDDVNFGKNTYHYAYIRSISTHDGLLK